MPYGVGVTVKAAHVCMFSVLCFAWLFAVIQLQNTVGCQKYSAPPLLSPSLPQSPSPLLPYLNSDLPHLLLIETQQLIIFYCMSVQKRKALSPKQPSMEALIGKHSDLLNFFSSCCGPKGYQDLAVALMREAIGSRLASGKHYHVEYVKHNRFLSPKQKEAVTPKVTEVVPVHQSPLKIYGKPRVKIDESQMVQEMMTATELPAVLVQKEMKTQPDIEKAKSVPGRVKQSQLQSQKYLSPCKQLPMESRQTKPPKSPQNKLKRQDLGSTGKVAPKRTIETNYQSTLKENNSGKMSVAMGSPKGGKIEKYENVESRIKFLVDRDKHSKQVEKQLEQQSRKIGELEERQEKLLIRQYQQLKEAEGHQASSTHQPHQECCCCSSDEQLTTQLLKMKTSGQQYKSTLTNIQSRLEPKVYKISSKPVYPMSSSSSSESSSEEVVVVGRY